MAEIRVIEDRAEKSRICEAVLADLKEWFEVESAVAEYIEKVGDRLFLAAVAENEPIGFISVEDINEHASEIYVMGVKRDFHRQGAGRELLALAEEELARQGKKYLLVKTLSERRPDEQYDKTRQFYKRVGFLPLCELDIWGKDNPCLLMIKNLAS
ncbi:GNAT family N-acetyltransferase [Candidatus Falkowbacteria bacterium]|nr:GNAT family N-acetyltransferase [Candidatus Falkowbacteria bacterium]